MCKETLQAMADKWPHSIVARTQIGEFTGGLLTPKTMANLDSQKKGPARQVRCGRKVGYLVSDLMDWIAGRTEIISEREAVVAQAGGR